MLRIFVIALIVILVPLGIYLAMRYGTPDELTFDEAVTKATTTAEGDMAPKVVVIASIKSVEPDSMICIDKTSKSFRVDYTGTAPEIPFAPHIMVKFVGHVHAGSVNYFHATQAYKP